MAGLLDLFGGGGNTGGMDLNQLVRPPDPLSDALAAMSERFAQAGQASRLPTSTLGAIGSALGGASTAARTAQTQYLDQAIKLQALKRSLRQAGIDERLAERLAPILAGGAGPAPAVTPMPGAPTAVPAAAPGAPPGAPSPFALPQVPDYSGALGDGLAPGFARSPTGGPTRDGQPPDEYIGGQLPGGGAVPAWRLPPPGGNPLKPTGLLDDPDTVIPTQGGAGAATTLASFRPASLVEPGGAGNGGTDPLDLRGLLAPDRRAAADPLAGLLATDATIQPGGADTLVRDETQSRLPVELASLTAPRSKAEIVQSESGGNPNIGYGGVDLSNKPRDQYGFPIWEGRMGPAGISHAGGKYQFQPGTWREGATALGITDFSEKSQDRVYEWTRAKYGDAPWRASESGGGRPGVQLAQYAPGGGQGGAPPLVGPGSGMIPGLNMTPQQVAAFNALYGLAGHTGSPLKEFLDIYYKSPEYLRQSEQEKAQGQRAVTEPSDIRIAQQKAAEDRVTKQMEQLGNARLSLAPNGILVPDGQGGQVRVQATVEQAVRAANGLPVPELGIKGMYPDTRSGAAGGTPGDVTRPAGPIAGEPVPTAQQKELQTYGTEVFKKEHATAQTARSTIDSTNELRKLLDDGIISGSGADARRGLLRLGQLVGITGKDENELVANTEAFISESGRNLTAALKGMGPPVSNIDVQVAQGIVGSRDQTVGGLKKILDLVEKNNRRVILEFNKKASMMPQTKEIPSFAVPEPYKYGAPIADGPNGPLWKNDAGKWVPLQ